MNDRALADISICLLADVQPNHSGTFQSSITLVLFDWIMRENCLLQFDVKKEVIVTEEEAYTKKPTVITFGECKSA